MLGKREWCGFVLSIFTIFGLLLFAKSSYEATHIPSPAQVCAVIYKDFQQGSCNTFRCDEPTYFLGLDCYCDSNWEREPNSACVESYSVPEKVWLVLDIGDLYDTRNMGILKER